MMNSTVTATVNAGVSQQQCNAMETVSKQFNEGLSTDRDSGHNLVMLTIRLRFKKRQVNRLLILNLETLRNGKCMQQYQLEVNGKFDQSHNWDMRVTSGRNTVKNHKVRSKKKCKN